MSSSTQQSLCARRAVSSLSRFVGAYLILVGSTALAGGPPQIEDFVAISATQNVWTVEGIVLDESPGSCTVDFGGLFAGESATPDAEGYFSFSKELEPEQTGIVSAVATDNEQKQSDTVSDYIHQ